MTGGSGAGMDREPPTTVATDAPRGAGAEASPAHAMSGRQWVLLWMGMVAVAWTGSLITALAGHGGHLAATLCLVMLLAATAFDAATSRIPNELTYPAMVIGLALGCAAHLGGEPARLAGSAGAAQSVLGLLACGGIGLASMAVAGMGGGDMKLLAAVGAILGMSAAMTVLLYALAAAVVYALANLAVRGRLNSAMREVAVGALDLVCIGRPPSGQETGARTIPLAVPVLAGLVLSRLVPSRTVWSWLGNAT